MIEADELPSPERPNVFALPSETTLRFLLLVGSLIAGVLVVAESLYYIVDQDGLNVVLRRCTTQTAAIADPAEQAAAFARCQAPHERHRVLWTLATLLVAVRSVLSSFSCARSARRRRRFSSLPVSLGVDEVVDAYAHSASSAPTSVDPPRGAARFGGTRPVGDRASPGLVVGFAAGGRCLAVLARGRARAQPRSGSRATTDAAALAFAVTALVPSPSACSCGSTARGPRLERLRAVGLLPSPSCSHAATLRSREAGADGRAAETITSSERGAAVHERSCACVVARRFITTLARDEKLNARRARASLDVGWVDGLIAGFVSFVYLPTVIRLVQAWFTRSPRQSGALVGCALSRRHWDYGSVSLRSVPRAGIDGRPRRGLALVPEWRSEPSPGSCCSMSHCFLHLRLLDGGWVEAIILAAARRGPRRSGGWANAVARAHLDSGTARRSEGPPRGGITCLGVTTVMAKIAESWRLGRGSSLVTRPVETWCSERYTALQVAATVVHGARPGGRGAAGRHLR
jgi:hypothetical protein